MTLPVASGGSPTRVARDGSMSLLWRVADDALDPGYALVADRDDSSSARNGRQRRSVTLGLALLLLGLLASAALVQTQRGAPAADRTRADLADRVGTATVEVDALATRVTALNKEAAQLQAAALSGSESDQALSEQVTALELRAGLSPVEGPGIQVLLTDGTPSRADENAPDLARVLDIDLQLTVNGLFAAGAEAVAINDQRITSLSAIRSAGDAVLVGYRPLIPPYTVTAIGEPERLKMEFLGGNAAAHLETLATAYGIGYDTVSEDTLQVPGRPDLSLRHAIAGSGS